MDLTANERAGGASGTVVSSQFTMPGLVSVAFRGKALAVRWNSGPIALLRHFVKSGRSELETRIYTSDASRLFSCFSFRAEGV